MKSATKLNDLWGWGNSSVDKVLAVQTRGIVSCACNPSARKLDVDPGAYWLAILAYLGKFQTYERPVFKTKGKQHLRNNP